MIQLGSVFRCNQPPCHRWVVLSDPAEHGGRFLFVDLTTLRSASTDDACVLDVGDYPLLTHKTTVADSRAFVGNVEGLARAVRTGDFSPLPDMPSATLRRIIEGGRASPELSSAKKGMLPR